MSGEDLIMELAIKQSAGGVTRIQPPVTAWDLYFRVDLEDPPNLILRNRQVGAGRSQSRVVVQRDRNWAVEVSETQITSPAIVRFHRTACNRYDYWIYGKDRPEYASCRWILDSFTNPHHRGGMKWLVI